MGGRPEALASKAVEAVSQLASTTSRLHLAAPAPAGPRPRPPDPLLHLHLISSKNSWKQVVCECKIGQIEVSKLPARKNVASGGVRGRRGWCTAEVWEEEEEEEEEQQEEEEEEEMTLAVNLNFKHIM